MPPPPPTRVFSTTELNSMAIRPSAPTRERNACKRLSFPRRPRRCKSCCKISSWPALLISLPPPPPPAGRNAHINTHTDARGSTCFTSLFILYFFSLCIFHFKLQLRVSRLLMSPPSPPPSVVLAVSSCLVSSSPCRASVCRFTDGFEWPPRRRCSPCRRRPSVRTSSCTGRRGGGGDFDLVPIETHSQAGRVSAREAGELESTEGQAGCAHDRWPRKNVMSEGEMAPPPKYRVSQFLRERETM